MLKKLNKNNNKNNVSTLNSINSMKAEEVLGVTLKEREYSSDFQNFKAGFTALAKKVMASATLDKHNHGFMDPLIDAQMLCEQDEQRNMESVVRIATADRLADRAKELKTILEEETAQNEIQLENLKNKLDRTVVSYNRSTYEKEEDYEVFENIDDKSSKALKNSRGFGPAVTILILMCLCLADAVNLYTTFESIEMLPFAVQIIMVVTSALLLQLLPFFCARIFGDLINTADSHKKRKNTSKTVLVAVLVTVFIAMCSGLTAVRFQVLGEDRTSVTDVTFSDTEQSEEAESKAAEDESSGSQKGYAVFLTILMVTTSAASFYLGFEDPLIKEIHILNERINGLSEDIHSKKATAQRLEGYTREYLLQLDEMEKQAILNHIVYEAAKLKVEARTMFYDGKDPEEVSYIEDSSAEIVGECDGGKEDEI